MPERYWLVRPDGRRHAVDLVRFDLERLANEARRIGGRLDVEGGHRADGAAGVGGPYEPPASALGPLFQRRLERLHRCRVPFALDVNPRPTRRVLGGYYQARRLVRVYSHDREAGRRPLEELFDTFLHEVAHHLEYTEPGSFRGRACGRVPGRMHSRLFWEILGTLKDRWAAQQARHLGDLRDGGPDPSQSAGAGSM